MNKIPIVDIGRLSEENGRTPSKDDWDKTVKEIEKALHGIGFLYLVNHGLPENTISTAFAESKAFFEMPTENKRKFAKDVTKGFHGWAQPNQERLKPDSSYEYRESFDFYKGRVSFPEPETCKFEKAMSSLESASTSLIKKLLRVFALSLKLEDPDFFIKAHTCLDKLTVPSFSTFRALYYPPCDQEFPPGTVRCGEHTDYGMLTLLFQDTMGGLEVKTVDNNWVPATPVPGAIVVNTGDLLEQWSGGYFPATAHRVLIPQEELVKKCNRFSMVYFVHPDDHILVSPLESEAVQNPKSFEPILAHDHCRKKLDQTYS